MGNSAPCCYKWATYIKWQKGGGNRTQQKIEQRLWPLLLTQPTGGDVDSGRPRLAGVRRWSAVIGVDDSDKDELLKPINQCSHPHIMEGTSRALSYTIRFIGLLGSHALGYIESRGVYGPTYGVEYTVFSNYYKYFEMNHVVEAFIILLGGGDTMEGLFTIISWASEGLHSKSIGLLNINGYFNNLIKFLDDAVRQNFMASCHRKLFISSFFIDELLDKLEFAKAFLGLGASYYKFANPGRLALELHL
ncbi:unnamed protein product [Cuscuta campestris]|uniref:cytokinin riboside 5'-monophosphate phosphoribohydrolase n=1 Tax=Cuscuta campestris TaxID=132261 RepID=A0A484NRX9_9ASTE|nr:unnamed protein product [Cuscuta campestris]